MFNATKVGKVLADLQNLNNTAELSGSEVEEIIIKVSKLIDDLFDERTRLIGERDKHKGRSNKLYEALNFSMSSNASLLQATRY